MNGARRSFSLALALLQVAAGGQVEWREKWEEPPGIQIYMENDNQGFLLVGERDSEWIELFLGREK